MSDLRRFESFLSGIDLARYREKHSKIKIVELDLPKPIQALEPIYKLYWNQRDNFMDYEHFYDYYAMNDPERRDAIEKFRLNSQFSHETFYRGLPARIYRTWASILTQIQGGYVAEERYGKGNVEMSAELDWAGVDFKIKRDGGICHIQVKKKTVSREVRRPWTRKNRGLEIVTIEYVVPGRDKYKQDGTERKPFSDWKREWAGKLDILPNGFVVFRPGIFEGIDDCT